jgi:hypothetical protein
MVTVAKAFKARGKRISIEFPAFRSPPINFRLTRVFSCIYIRRMQTKCRMIKKGMKTGACFIEPVDHLLKSIPSCRRVQFLVLASIPRQIQPR